MANWYIDSGITGTDADPVTGVAGACGPDTSSGTAGDDAGGEGSPGNPWKTIQGSGILFGVLNPGDTVYLAGRHRAAATEVYLISQDGTGGGVRWTQWVGRSPAQIRGENLPGGDTTTDPATALSRNKTISATYWVAQLNGWYMNCDGTNGKADLTAHTSLASVTYDWDKTANIDTVGRRKSHMEAYPHDGVSDATTIATMLALTPAANRGKYFLGGGTGGGGTHELPGRLAVLLPSGSTPANATANGVEVCARNRTAMLFIDTGTVTPHVGNTVDSLECSRWCDAAATAPYGNSISMLGSVGARIHTMRFIDVGDHAWAFGAKVVNPTVYNCTIIGGATGCYYMVFNASGAGNDAVGCTATNITVYANSLLAHDGVTTNKTDGQIVCYVHGPHSAARSIVWSRINVIQYTPPSGTGDTVSPVDSGDGTAPAGTALSYYPILVEDCTFTNCTHSPTIGVTSYIGFRRTAYRSATNLGGVYVQGFIDRSSVTGRWRMDMCEISGDLQNGLGGGSLGLLVVGSGAFIFDLHNCSLYNKAASHSVPASRNYGICYHVGTAGQFLLEGCWLGFRATDTKTRVCVGDSAFTSPQVLASRFFVDNAYFNIGYDAGSPANVWCQQTSYDSKAEWTGAIDTGDGFLDNATTNPFANTNGSDLSLTTAAKALKHSIPANSAAGINGLPYSQNYGAYQYGQFAGGGLGHTSDRTGGRLARLTR